MPVAHPATQQQNSSMEILVWDVNKFFERVANRCSKGTLPSERFCCAWGRSVCVQQGRLQNHSCWVTAYWGCEGGVEWMHTVGNFVLVFCLAAVGAGVQELTMFGIISSIKRCTGCFKKMPVPGQNVQGTCSFFLHLLKRVTLSVVFYQISQF